MQDKLKKTALTAMFAAMITVATAVLKVPVASGYVHLGDALVYLCASFLGAPYALIAAAIGAGLADVFGGYAMYAPASVIVKALTALLLVPNHKQSMLCSKRAAALTVPAGLVTVGGYFIADLIIAREYAIVDLPGNLVQALSNAIVFIVLAAALDKIGIKKRMFITEK